MMDGPVVLSELCITVSNCTQPHNKRTCSATFCHAKKRPHDVKLHLILQRAKRGRDGAPYHAGDSDPAARTHPYGCDGRGDKAEAVAEEEDAGSKPINLAGKAEVGGHGACCIGDVALVQCAHEGACKNHGQQLPVEFLQQGGLRKWGVLWRRFGCIISGRRSLKRQHVCRPTAGEYSRNWFAVLGRVHHACCRRQIVFRYGVHVVQYIYNINPDTHIVWHSSSITLTRRGLLSLMAMAVP